MSDLKLGQIYKRELDYVKEFDSDTGIIRIVDDQILINDENINKERKNLGNSEGQAQINYYKVPQKLLSGEDDPELYTTLESNFFDFELKYNFEKGVNYYLNFKSENRIDRTYEIKVYLYNENNKHTQYIQRYRIIAGGELDEENRLKKGFSTYELIFQPNEAYSSVRFEIIRTVEDYLDNFYRRISFPITQEEDSQNYNTNFRDFYHSFPEEEIESGEDKNVYNYKEENEIIKLVQNNSTEYQGLLSVTNENQRYPHGMVIEIKINRLLQLNNVLEKLNKENDQDVIIKRIGVQANPNLLMCINGEGIRVGNSGLYEPIVDYVINFFSFIPREDKYFNVMIDCQYKEIV